VPHYAAAEVRVHAALERCIFIPGFLTIND